MEFHPIWNWDYGIMPVSKLELRDYAGFEIGIAGLQDPTYGGPNCGSHPGVKGWWLYELQC